MLIWEIITIQMWQVMVISSDQPFLGSVYLNKYSISTNWKNGSSPLYLLDLQYLVEMLIVKNPNIIRGPGEKPRPPWRTSSCFFHDYTKLADLAFLHCFVVKNKINSAKSLPPIGIELATLGLWHPLCLHSYTLTNVSTHHCLNDWDFKHPYIVMLYWF